MSANATQQIEPNRGRISGTTPGIAPAAPGRTTVQSALGSPIQPGESRAARVQLADASQSRLGPGQRDRQTRDVIGGISIGPGGVSGGVVVTPPGVPVYGGPVYGPVYAPPPVYVPPVVVAPPPVYVPPVIVQPPYYQPPVVVAPRPWWNPWHRPPVYGRPPQQCSWLEYIVTPGAFKRGNRYFCP